jgi:hypothetical protein
MTNKLDLGSTSNIIVPSSVFFPWLARELIVIRIGSCAFVSLPIRMTTIPRHVQIFSLSYFSDCESLSSISFETGSELTRTESNAFHFVLLSNQSQFLKMFNLLMVRDFRMFTIDQYRLSQTIYVSLSNQCAPGVNDRLEVTPCFALSDVLSDIFRCASGLVQRSH